MSSAAWPQSAISDCARRQASPQISWAAKRTSARIGLPAESISRSHQENILSGPVISHTVIAVAARTRSDFSIAYGKMLQHVDDVTVRLSQWSGNRTTCTAVAEFLRTPGRSWT